MARTTAHYLGPLSLLCLGACTSNAAKPEAGAGSGRSSIETRWVKARQAQDLPVLEHPAHVLSGRQSLGAVSVPYQARVSRVHVEPGQRIEQGATVVDVVMPSVVAAAGAWIGARTRHEAYSRRKAQLDRLRVEGLVRLSEIAEVETKLAEARADQQTALATLRSAGLGPSEASRVISGSGAVSLRAPIAGVVTEVDAAVGEVREAAGKPLVRIAAAAATRVEARLAQGLPAGARFELVTSSGQTVALRWVSQAPIVDRRDGTTLAWFETTGKERLLGGTSGRLRVRLPAGSAVAVPAAAVLSRKGQAEVLVRDGARVRRVSVRLLLLSGADAVVSGELKVGQDVAADAALAEGSTP